MCLKTFVGVFTAYDNMTTRGLSTKTVVIRFEFFKIQVGKLQNSMVPNLKLWFSVFRIILLVLLHSGVSINVKSTCSRIVDWRFCLFIRYS